ncbi:hypothetical protein N431DRAFT_429814 [Stipitochalara longipes BDJ]|nr:hypothetical protein N431DRAFT_429814 [Stipitochalara longipes BDJ]
MRASILEVLAFAAAAQAQTSGFDPFSSPADQSKWNVNDVLPIAWNATVTGGTITLTLIGGSSSKDLAPVTVIAAHINNAVGAPSTFAWPIPPNIGTFASYGVNLTLDGGSDFQYSDQFYISGGTGGGSSPTTTGSDTTITQTTQTTGTITVANSTTSVGTTSLSGNLTLTSKPTKTSGSVSVTPTGTGSSAATPSPTKNAGSVLRLGGAGLVGIGGAVMVFML